jgi:DNA repair exonuclease SbcCD ATPase subunit
MTLRGASEYLGISKNRIWRAVKDGHLAAEEGRFKGQKALTVTQGDLDEWAKVWLTAEDLEGASASKHLEAPCRDLGVPDKHLEVFDEEFEAPNEHLEASQGVQSRFKGVWSHSDESLRDDLVAALERSHQEVRLVERRAIELELQLRQHQMLLTENAESLQERDARVKEAEAKLQAIEDAKQAELNRLTEELTASQAREAEARDSEAQLKAAEEARRTEAERLQAELASTRQQLAEAQKPAGLFSWLGLRKKRTGSVAAKAKTG